MKSWFNIYIFIALYCFGMVSCTDESMVEEGNLFDEVVVRLTLSVPGADSRVSGDYQPDKSGLDEQTVPQRFIDDAYILLFNSDDHTLIAASPATFLDNNNGEATRTIKGKFTKQNSNLDVVVLTNVLQNDITVNFADYKDKTEKEIYEALVYKYPEAGWKLENKARFLPMWGKKTNITLNQREISISNFELYRGVAKMGLQVAETCDNFTMKEIYVYHVNNKGYCVAPNEIPNPDVNIQYTKPDVPSSSSLLTEAIKYELTDDQAKSFLEQIYLSESDNITKTSEAERLKVVVGGVYTGPGLVADGAISYYRIDMEDDKNQDGVLAPFDIIRNHSYIFNITKVSNPGTPTPDEALDEAVVGLTVVVEDWTDEYMRGVPDQYTLTTNRSVITYEAYNDKNGQTIDIWTDYSDGWYLEGLDEAESAWLNISANSGEDNLTKTITLTPKADNNGVTRTASFYVVAGNIKKEITVRQPQPPTANCYVRGNGEYELIVTIKGNGNDGIMPEGADIVPGDGDASITPDKIGIIWETKAGLVKLKDPLGEVHDNTAGTLALVDYNKTTNSIKYVVNTTGATIGGAVGGNALIGAFKNTAAEGATPVYEVIWSWHIWVSPDLIDSETQIVKESAVEKWTLNDYDVLDRNLGALANKPINNNSVASMGLLYQWGRKDPFIGAKYSNDNFTGDGLLDVVHYYDKWDIDNLNGSTANAIEHTIANPTHLIHKTGTGWNPTSEGLASLVDNGGYLWGTDKGFVQDIIDLGSKTIYDPCPVGYRVPPVDAFVFKKQTITTEWSRGETFETITINRYSSKDYDFAVYYKRTDRNDWTLAENGTISNNNNSNRSYNVAYAIAPGVLNTIFTSEETNWNENLIYIPHRATGTRTSGNIWYYVGNYVTNANYYGFWMNYTENSVPALASGNHTDGEIHYELANYNNLTWLPLTGAYDPTKGFAFKDDDGNTIQVTQGSSLTVNSFLWTNSRITNENGNKVPGAMFLHGTEVNSTVNGRHIHYLNATDITAEPHQAGAVRCVRDRVKTKWDENTLSSTASIGNTVGSTTTINIVSVNADWELIDPGKPWLQVTPDKGSADKGAGTEITLKMLEAGHSGETATLVFKIANETETRSCVVTVQ